MKKKLQKLIFLLGISLFASGVNAQVTVTATAGVPTAGYTTLNDALNSINLGTHQGMIDINITANTTEPAIPFPLVSSGTGAASYTLVIIRPTGDVTVNSAATPTGGRGVIEFLGADNVIIEGDDAGTAGTRNLSFVAAMSATTGVAVVRFASASAADGATNNTIRNCIITGSRNGVNSTVANYGIYSGTAGTAATSTSGQSDNNDNLTIENNLVTRCYWGIYCAGTTANYMDNLIIRNNVVGSSVATDAVANRGIYVQNTQAVAAPTITVAQIDGNNIQMTASNSSTADMTSLEIANGNCGIQVYKNHFHDIFHPNTGGYGAYGIWISGSTNNSAVTIYNNFIANIYTTTWGSTTTTSDFNAGILISVAAQGIRINHNSISLQTANVGVSAYHSACIYFGSATANVAELQNNIFVNTQGSGTGSFARGIFTNATANISAATVNFNNYYVTGTSGYIGRYNAAEQTTFANWKTATGKDVNSYNINPGFVSASDLHIPAATNNILESGGATLSITTDFDGDARPGPAGSVNGGGTAPDVGADEFDGTPLALCTGSPAASNAQSTLASVCSGANFTLSLSVTYTELGYTYQWQSSPDGIAPYTNIGGATNTSFTTNQTAATYYQCVITCTNSGMSTISTPIQVTMNPFTSCYCTVTFPSAVEPITLVDFAGINNTTSNVVGGSPAQENFTAMTANVNKGYTYPITLKGNTDGNFTTYLSVFIDFNQNGLYTDLGETFNIGTITNSTGIDAIQLTGNITIPMTALTGLTGMRVIKKYNANALPCNNTGFGQAEDYTIMINPCVPPAIVTLTASDVDGAICPGQSVVFTGPTGYVYNDFQLNAGSVQTGTGNTYTNGTLANGDQVTLVAGYDVTCATAATPITITHHSVPVGTIAPFDASCNGAADGSMDLTVTSGTPSYTYLWSNGATSEDISGLIAGTYSVTITDANGCTANASAGIAQPTAINVSSTQSNVSCFGGNNGSIDLTVSGGAGGYTFDWNNDGTGDFDDAEDLSSLVAGTYNGVVMDMNGCTNAGSIIITEPALLAVTATATDISCNGLTDGSINATVTGGTTAYIFDWDNDGTGDNDDTEDLSALAAGTFNLTVMDANGCSATATATVIEPAVLSATASPVDISCNGANDGVIALTVAGGTSPFTYDWDNDGTGDNDDTEDLSALSAGTYNVTVTDDNGCTTTASAGIAEPAAFNVTVTTTDVSCFGLSDGAIDLNVSGGTAPYDFDWDIDGTGDFDDTEDLTGLPSGTYIGALVDANGCTDGGSIIIAEPTEIIPTITATDITCFGNGDGSIDLSVTGGAGTYTFDWDNDGTGDNDDTEDLTALSAGTYTVNIIDADNCSVTTSASITEPGAITASVTATDISCNGLTDGSVDLTITGGTSPFTIDWDNDGTGDNDDTEDLTGLGAGTFTVVVMDANGCPSSSANGTVVEPAALILTPTITNANCDNSSDGAIDLAVTGGTGAYTYDWDNDGTGDNDDTEDLSGLSSGNFTVFVTDANGCSANNLLNVPFDNVSPTVTLTVSPTVACNTEGAMTLGGESPAGGIWSGNGVTGSTFDPAAATIGLNTITYTFTDGNGCSNSAQDDIQVDDCSGITENASNAFNVYPNPTLGMITITSDATNGNLIIRDAIGKVVYSATFISEKIMVDMSNYSRGMYTITLETSTGNMIQKVVKD